jgi:hypothetical protein
MTKHTCSESFSMSVLFDRSTIGTHDYVPMNSLQSPSSTYYLSHSYPFSMLVFSRSKHKVAHGLLPSSPRPQPTFISGILDLNKGTVSPYSQIFRCRLILRGSILWPIRHVSASHRLIRWRQESVLRLTYRVHASFARLYRQRLG